ncbi:casein kinase 1 family protein [Phanerochaete sordida]|uniref:Casein kinase 1 family protein n=1 Tax=Phanerochaete sordida TaxID=48140 RepID=A0A9P3LL35_9APHY|nr:casein kinase 1 family protein [Phanerochaete sordida]
MSPHYPQRVGNWWLGECLGSGYSGAIFKATHLHNQQVVALKLQDVEHECPTNRYERGFYPTLQGGEGMPTLYASGVEGDWDWLAISLLGPSLDSLYRKSGMSTMDLRSVCSIAMQMISRLELMHNRGILHRDIQLGNCVIGLPPHEKKIYMIDFGFSKRYIDSATGRHLEDNNKKRDFIGNYWFSSVNVHCRGRIPTRRDDMEALALMLIHLLTPGGLSWTRNGVPKTDAAHTRLKREKAAATPADLCGGLPDIFEEFLRYCRRLKFAECPDYEEWRARFMDLAVDSGFPEDDAFVWPLKDPKPYVRPTAAKPKPSNQRNMEGILKDLADMHLTEARQVLGERANANNVSRAVQRGVPLKKARFKNPEDAKGIVVISDSEVGTALNARLTKAEQLAELARVTPNAVDNAMLAQIVRQFAEVLETSKSKALTKEGFAVLDAVHRQLADPSVFIVPMRTSRTRSDTQQEAAPEGDARRAKMDKLFALRRDVATAKSNRMLAKMVTEFGACIDKSRGRTVTKDAVGFLHNLADRLNAMP